MTHDHLTEAELTAYSERRLAAGEALLASDHLVECEECRTQLLQLAGSQAAAVSGEPRDDLSYEELVGWLDDELDPMTRREVAATLAQSPRARAELADLMKFREEMNTLPARDHAEKIAAPETGRGSVPRWAFALAAAVVLSGAAIWRATTPKPDAADFVKLRDGDNVIAFTNDGRSQALAGLPATISAEVARVIRSGRVELTPDITAIVGQTGTLAGPAETDTRLRVLEPVGTAVRERRPRFRWAAAPDASAYQINVVEETSDALIVSEQLPATTTVWQPPSPLAAGEVYQWEVQALRDGAVVANSPKPPEPEARFQVLSQAKIVELEEAKRVSKGSHLVMGVANARAGLIDEALREFRLLTEQNPDAELPRQLLQQLEAQRARRP